MKKYTIIFVPSDPKAKSLEYFNITNMTFSNTKEEIEISNEQMDLHKYNLNGDYSLYSDGKSKGTVSSHNMIAIQVDEGETVDIPLSFFEEMNR